MLGYPALAGVPAPLLPVLVYYYFLPSEKFHQSRVRPVVHQRWMSMGRIVYASALFNALAWVTFLTGRPAPLARKPRVTRFRLPSPRGGRSDPAIQTRRRPSSTRTEVRSYSEAFNLRARASMRSLHSLRAAA